MVSSLPQHCTPTNSLLLNISSIFHTCVPTPLALLSTVLGICSIFAWLCAQLPQIVKNFELKSASGLSILFLVEWLLGDATNLVGGLLTGQATWQIVIAAYYVTVDLVMLSQYLWYTHFRPRRIIRVEESKLNRPDGDSDDSIEGFAEPASQDGQNPAGINRSADRKIGRENSQGSMNGKFHPGRSHQSYFGFDLREKLVLEAAADQHTSVITRKPTCAPITSKNALFLTSALHLMAAAASPLYTSTSTQSDRSQGPNAQMIIGQITSWVCTCLYLGSRIPQIYKNHQRRSTAGLSPALFISAFCGNFFYSSSLLSNPLAWSSYPPYGHHGWSGPEGSDRATWVRLAAPFWLGSFGVLALDAVIGVQFLRYGEPAEGEAAAGENQAAVVVVVDDNDSDETRGRRRRWHKVTGWMRGWIPSPGPARAPDSDLSPGSGSGLDPSQSRTDVDAGEEEEEGRNDETTRLLRDGEQAGAGGGRYGAS